MKKYVGLLTLTTSLVIMVLLIPGMVIAFVPTVKVTQITHTNYSSSINATGTVEEKSKTEIKLDVPVVAKKVNCKVGDNIQIGDTIATVDKQQTIIALANINSSTSNSSDTSGLPAGLASILASKSLDKSVMYDTIPNEIISTASGVITGSNINEGALMIPGNSIVTISDVSDLCVKASFGEDNLPNVKCGQTVEISGTSIGDKKYSGKVQQIYPTARKQIIGLSSETVVDVMISIDDIDQSIIPGLNVKASIEAVQSHVIDILPYDCISQSDDGTEHVYVYKDGKAVKTPIKTGLETGEGVEVTDGISKDDYVICHADKIKKDNQYVTVTALSKY